MKISLTDLEKKADAFIEGKSFHYKDGKNIVCNCDSPQTIKTLCQSLRMAMEALDKASHPDHCEYWNECTCSKNVLSKIKERISE